MKLTTSLDNVKGVGPKTFSQLQAAGLETVNDLITFLPRKFDDYTEVVAIADISPGKKTIKARCQSIEVRRVRRGMTVTTATLADSSGKLKAVWFNQPYRATQLKNPQEEFFFSGTFEFTYKSYQLTNPSTEKVSDMPISTDRIVPVYRAVKGLKSQLVRKILLELKPLITMLPETLPPEVVAKQQLVSYSQALLGMHFPGSLDDIAQARQRLAFEELFQLLLASQLNRQANSRLTGWPIPFDLPVVKQFVASLPFELTAAQRRAAWDIIQDFERSIPMNRLLQGDVGAGKTVVAGLAARNAAQAGYQTAIMAPTEILASQHAETLHKLLEPAGVSVGLLTGSVKGKARQALYQAIETGDIDVVIGTHALIQEAVKFHRLGFVAIDEQHRFGVAQRQQLLDKADKLPHMLAMTATPIPRSLQLTVFGDLDISIINQLPKNRLPIKTELVSPVSASKIYQAIDSQIEQGRQAYVVCSLIDDSPTRDQQSVEAEYKKLKNSVLGKRRIAILHGRMKAGEKDQIMTDFKQHKFDILIATTVIEVGVDVPNASVIMIEDADSFGLAQLHQLRGRVGRGEYQSYCYLMLSSNQKPSQRLREIEKSTDGFYLAEVDLKLRGPGEIYGRAQHGDLNLEIANIGDSKLVARVQKAVDQFMATEPDLLQYKQLYEQVSRYQRLTTLN